MNQIVLYAERLPDSVQRDHIDWGFILQRCMERITGSPPEKDI